jgi:chlorobactene lauroyltransferase
VDNNHLMTEIPGQNQTGFIPAQESKLVTSLFGWYAKWLFRSRFKRVWLKQSYQPASHSRTIYYLNHSSWWDGLIPLLLNRYLLHQRGRAMMEDKQMLRYRFFRRIGAFSVNLDNPRNSLPSLRYALDSMKRENASLYIYPEGKIVPFTVAKPDFRGGLTWLCDRLPEVDVVPVGIYIHTMRHSKPELHISIGEPVDRTGFDNSGAGTGLQHFLEQSLQNLLIELQENSGFDDSVFKRWF